MSEVRMRWRQVGSLGSLYLLVGCTDLSQIGRTPEFSALEGSNQHFAVYSAAFPESNAITGPAVTSSLWSGSSESLLGDRRAARRGDILTVVIEIDDSAKIQNSSGRKRSGESTMQVPQLFGIPQRVDQNLPDGASMASAVDTGSTSSFSGSGNITRSEKLTLRIAATIVEQLPNGVLRLEGQQEVRVNYEMRELIVTGYIRPSDISRQNEVTYDKIAGARIAYGGRGQVTDVQQPRYGQQITDALLPF